MQDKASKPRLSVVIPTLGRPILLDTLRSILRARGATELEIVVAGKIEDGEVLAGLQDLMRAHPQVQHAPVSFPAGDSSRKKNEGLRLSRADIVAFVDDDIEVCEDWPERIREPFADARVGLVSGPGLTPAKTSLLARVAGAALSSRAAGYVAGRYKTGQAEPRDIRWSGIIGCNMAYRRPVIEGLGGFDPGFWPGEEMLAAFRTEQQGHRLVFHPGARAWHFPRRTLVGFCKQMYGYGATRIRLNRAGVECEPTTLIPGLWTASLVGLGLAALWTRWGLWLLLADVAFYAAAAALVAILKAIEDRRWDSLLVFLLAPVMHISYGAGQWVELLRPGKDLSERQE